MLKKLLFDLFIKKNDSSGMQLFRYIFAGGIAAAVNIGTFAFCTEALSIYYLVGNIFGFAMGLVSNYILCKLFVFTDAISIPKAGEFILHGIVSIISLGIDTSVLWSCTSFLGLYPLASKLVATGAGFLWNFSGRKIIYVKLKQSDTEQ
ncbi:MAG: GtrA family protein [Tannerellaceae bacterium]|jgi:putative flippase GtrA|nr:GtrA family protein [Tannerellaceae bacterium]